MRWKKLGQNIIKINMDCLVYGNDEMHGVTWSLSKICLHKGRRRAEQRKKTIGIKREVLKLLFVSLCNAYKFYLSRAITNHWVVGFLSTMCHNCRDMCTNRIGGIIIIFHYHPPSNWWIAMDRQFVWEIIKSCVG